MRGSLVAASSPSERTCPLLGRSEKEYLKIAQEVIAACRGAHALQVALDEAAALGFGQRTLDRRRRQARALGEARELEAFGKTQCVEHELERELIALHLDVLRERVALGERGRHVALGIAKPHLAHHTVREGQLAVRARADAEVVAELPVVQ